MDNAIVLTIVIAYFLLMFAIGIWANKKTSSAKEYLVAGQSLGFFMMAIASFSSIQSGWGMVGATGSTYDWGLQALVSVAMIAPLGFIAAWFLLGRRLFRAAQHHKMYSLPDVIKARFQSTSTHKAMSWAVLLGSIAYMTAQVTAIGIILSLLLGTSLATSAWIGSVVVAIYTMAGGMLAAVWTDLIQGIIMVVMSVGIFIFAVQQAGGWMPMLDTIYAKNPALLSGEGSQSMTYIFAFMIMMFLGSAGQPQLLTKFLMLRKESELKWGAAVAAIAYFITSLFSLGVGLSVRSMVDAGFTAPLENIDNTATWFLDSVAHPVVGGIALTGLLAAIMSSASSFITIGASSLMRDLAGAYKIRVTRELLFGRIASAVIVLAGLLFALYLSQVVFLLGALGWAAFGAAVVGPVVLSMYWPRAHSAAATITIWFAIISNLLITALASQGILTIPQWIHIGAGSTLLSIAMFVGISLALPQDANIDKLMAPFSTAKNPTTTFGNSHLVVTTGLVAAITAAAMFLNNWQIVFFSLPTFVYLLFMIGSSRLDNSKDPVATVAVTSYSAVLFVLFIAATFTMTSASKLWGIQVGMGIIVYFIWPYTVFGGSLLYAFVFSRTTNAAPLPTPQHAEKPGEPAPETPKTESIPVN